AVELALGAGQAMEVGDLRGDPALDGERHHAGREVDRLDVGAELALEPLRELAPAAADVEHPGRRPLGDRSERDVLRVVALYQPAIDGVALGLPLLARVL